MGTLGWRKQRKLGGVNRQEVKILSALQEDEIEYRRGRVVTKLNRRCVKNIEKRIIGRERRTIESELRRRLRESGLHECVLRCGGIATADTDTRRSPFSS